MLHGNTFYILDEPTTSKLEDYMTEFAKTIIIIIEIITVIMGHDVKIGKYCQINSFSFFAGYANTGDCVTVNAGAKLIQNVKVEEEAVVGMGSVVLSKVKRGTTVFGIPAKRLKF